MGRYLQNTLGYVFYLIDYIIYYLVELLFFLFFEITDHQFLNSDIIKSLSDKIYLLVGIYMLFNIAVVLLNNLVNPDKLKDSDKGAGKIVSKVLISLSLLILTPMIFTTAFKFQRAVIKSGIIPGIFLGQTERQSPGELINVGKSASDTAFFAFFRLNRQCNDYDIYMVDYSEIVEAGRNAVIDNIAETCKSVNGKKISKYNYKYIISTLVGIFIAWIVLNYNIEITLRMIKLGVLQLLAPIPILSYVLPDNAAFNNWVKACTTVYLDVFIRLIIIFFSLFGIEQIANGGAFVKIAYNLESQSSGIKKVVYKEDFKTSNGLSLEYKEGTNNYYPLKVDNKKYDDDLSIEDKQEEAKLYIQVIGIIGLLLFAQQAPKLLQNIFGIKGNEWSGNIGLDSVKGLKSGFAGAALGGVAGGLGGAIGNLSKGNWGGGLKGVMQGLGSGVAGGFSGAFHGGKTGYDEKTSFGETVVGGIRQAGANRERRQANQQGNYSLWNRTTDRVRSATGNKTTSDKMQETADNFKKGLVDANGKPNSEWEAGYVDYQTAQDNYQAAETELNLSEQELGNYQREYGLANDSYQIKATELSEAKREMELAERNQKIANEEYDLVKKSVGPGQIFSADLKNKEQNAIQAKSEYEAKLQQYKDSSKNVTEAKKTLDDSRNNITVAQAKLGEKRENLNQAQQIKKTREKEHGQLTKTAENQLKLEQSNKIKTDK